MLEAQFGLNFSTDLGWSEYCNVCQQAKSSRIQKSQRPQPQKNFRKLTYLMKPLKLSCHLPVRIFCLFFVHFAPTQSLPADLRSYKVLWIRHNSVKYNFSESDEINHCINLNLTGLSPTLIYFFDLHLSELQFTISRCQTFISKNEQPVNLMSLP